LAALGDRAPNRGERGAPLLLPPPLVLELVTVRLGLNDEEGATGAPAPAAAAADGGICEALPPLPQLVVPAASLVNARHAFRARSCLSSVDAVFGGDRSNRV
jgi:hypothetical protein